MAVILDETTLAAYQAQTLASNRAALVVSALTGTVVVEVRDGTDALRASGTMAAPWANASGATITIGEVNATGLLVTNGGAPDADWYCQFRSGTRFVRGSFGVSTSSADFKWSLPSFDTGSRGTLGTVLVVAQGTTAAVNVPPVWTTVPTITLTQGGSFSIASFATDADNDPLTYGLASGTLPTGVTLSSGGVLTASSTATLGTVSNIVVFADDGQGSIAPSNTVLPSISGIPKVGQTLTASPGTWAGSTPIMYAYQWLRNGVAISGATSITYLLVAADEGALISVRVTGTNAVSSAQATSASVGAISPPDPVGALSIPLTLTSAAGGTNLPWTFAQVFKKGDFPAASTLTISAGEFQATPTSYWSDGSVRHAIIAGRTTLAAATPTGLTLSLGAATGGPTLTIADLKTAIPASTSVTVGATTMTLSGTFLDTPFRTVCTGPVMSNWIYRLPVSGSNHLVIWADVRLYKGGTVEVFPWVENAYLLVASPATVTGVTCSVSVGGVTRYSQTFDIAHHTRIPLVTGLTFSHWTSDPQITPRHDAAYLRSTRLIPNYAADATQSSVLAGLVQTYTPNSRAEISSSMGVAGTSAAILPPQAVMYIQSGDVRAWNAAMVHDLSGGSWSIHYRDENTNEPVNFVTRSGVSIQGGTPALPANTGATNGTAVVSHQPSYGFFGWATTGRWWFLDELQLWAVFNFLYNATSNRKNALGVIRTDVGANTDRGGAWGLRTLVHLASVLPTTHPNYAAVQASVEANVQWYYDAVVTGTEAGGFYVNNVLGHFPYYVQGTPAGNPPYGRGVPSGFGYFAGWWANFLALVHGYAWDVEPPQSAASRTRQQAVRDHAYKWPVGMSGDGSADAWNWRRITMYSMPSVNASGQWVTTFGQARSIYESDTWGENPTTALGAIPATPGLTLKGHSSNNDLSAAASSSEDYFPFALAALAYAAEHGAPGAVAGWGRVTGSNSFGVWRTSYGNVTKTAYAFNIAPRA